jgi:hypothetical protein
VECEEAALIDLEVYEEVIIPTLSMDTSAILISTVLGSDNAYSKILELKHDITGNYLFKQIRITLACKRPACRINPRTCIHTLHLIPWWKSPFKQQIATSMISDDRIAAREMGGLIMDEGIKIFDAVLLEKFFSTRIVDLNTHGKGKFMITVVDPNNDGSSDYAIVTLLVTTRISIVRISLYLIFFYFSPFSFSFTSFYVFFFRLFSK